MAPADPGQEVAVTGGEVVLRGQPELGHDDDLALRVVGEGRLRSHGDGVEALERLAREAHDLRPDERFGGLEPRERLEGAASGRQHVDHAVKPRPRRLRHGHDQRGLGHRTSIGGTNGPILTEIAPEVAARYADPPQHGEAIRLAQARTPTNVQLLQRVNGLDMQAASATTEAIRANPALGRFQFRARNTWIGGAENRSMIQDFYGAGREDMSRVVPFILTNGKPPVLLGQKEGANPVEFLLHALAGCVTTPFVLHAAARGVAIRKLSTELEGDLDVRGVLDLDPTTPAGFRQITIHFRCEADCSDEELADLVAFAQQYSPVCNTVCRPVPVTIERVS
jgi:uncharacterized OsmC-like protein